MTRGAVLAAALLAAPAQADEASDRALLLDAVRANGCAMTDAEADRLLPPPGSTRDRTWAASTALVAEGLATATARGLTLAPVVCAGSDEAPGGALGALVAAAGEGCAMPWAEAAALVPKAELASLLGRVAGTGTARRDGDALQLDPALCRPTMPGSPAMDVRRRVAAAQWVAGRLAAEPGCALPRAALAGAGVAVGIGPADLDQALLDLGARAKDGGTVALAACAP